MTACNTRYFIDDKISNELAGGDSHFIVRTVGAWRARVIVVDNIK